MQRGSQIRLHGYGDLKTAVRRCDGLHGNHCAVWVAQIEIIRFKSPALAVTVSARTASLGPWGHAGPGQLGWT